MKNSKYIVFSLFILMAGLLYWGCSEDANPLPSKAHTEDWMNPQSDEFHGDKVNEIGYETCKSCHADDFSGGESGSSCYESGCHTTFPHPPEWLVLSDELFHGNIIRQAAWSMDNCKKCHGDDYKGGSSGASCYDCHQEGPEACNVCHGGGKNIHPPQDLSGNIKNTAMGVGAHQEHMALAFMSCESCHLVPESFDADTHIDGDGRAEVKEQWGWDRTTGGCATSCHGGDLIWNNFGH